MKILTALAIATAFLTSCRVPLPIDPNTGRPSTRCLPYGSTSTTVTYESAK